MSTLKVVTAVAVLYIFYRLARMGHRDKRLPPGPPTLPIIGNLHQIPVTGIYKKFKEWGEQYGKVFSLKMGSGTMIVLYDRRAIHELLDKKGTIYSERPIDHVVSLVTNGDSFAFMDSTPLWRNQRKIASHTLAPRMLDEKVSPIQDAEVSMFLSDMVQTPADFFHHVERTTASVANIIVWGYRGQKYEDFWGSCVYRAMDQYSAALEPGANPPVDQFPFLKYLPDFMSAWRTRAKHSYKAMDDIWNEARRRVDQRRETGDKRNSIADQVLDGEKGTDLSLNDHQLNHFLGILVEGGADTTSASLLTSILMLVLNPHVQRKAQKQLDAVCGTERTPVWSDFEKLPYINCIVKESMRWHPNLPLGVPHRVNKDDWFDGMLIPKDATVVIPIWAIQNSEKHGFEDPTTYRPERYERHPRLAPEYAGSPDYENRDHYAYGAGRRICPGMHLAERTMWRMTAKLLWAFDIEHAVDPETGDTVPIDAEKFKEGISHSPQPFKAVFRPRSQAHIATIRREAALGAEKLHAYE